MSDENNETPTENTSTLKSYVDSATGAVQSAIGSVTGGGHGATTTKEAPPAPSGSETKYTDSSEEPSSGSSGSSGDSGDPTPYPKWNQTVGAAKESIGNITGHEGLRRAGIDQNKQGKAEEAKGQLKDLGEGMVDRAQGAVGSVGAAITGDREEEEKWRKVHDEGKEQAKGAVDDMDKRHG